MTGQVMHHRLQPWGHGFRYRLALFRLDLDELPRLSRTLRLLGVERARPLTYRAADHLSTDNVRARVRTAGVTAPVARMELVTSLRTFGYVFNPVSFWFCHRRNGELRAIVCEVNNTFGERHCYLLDTGDAMAWGMTMSAKKVFHVSPFCAVEGQYRFRFMRTTQHVGNQEIERIVSRIDYDDAQGPLLLTSISGRLQPLSTAYAALAFLRHPLMTLGVIARIHWQALKLFIKRVPFFSKPLPPPTSLSR